MRPDTCCSVPCAVMSSLHLDLSATCTSYVSIREGRMHFRTIANCDIVAGNELTFTYVDETTGPMLIVRQEPVKVQVTKPSALKGEHDHDPLTYLNHG